MTFTVNTYTRSYTELSRKINTSDSCAIAFKKYKKKYFISTKQQDQKIKIMVQTDYN